MAIAIECLSVADLVKDSEVINYSEKKRTFDYDLNEKAAKAKLLKGARRISFEVFNLGSWNKVVLPSFRYWDVNKSE